MSEIAREKNVKIKKITSSERSEGSPVVATEETLLKLRACPEPANGAMA
jgi:hypothetical protein